MSNFLRRYSEILSIALTLLVIFLFFAKPILGGLPVSKLFLLSHRDLLFSQFQNLSQYLRSDASLYLLAAPNFFTVAQCWREGVIPLWNPYVGMGFPEVGDLQSCIFSPWRLLAALNPTVAYYNLQLFFQIGFASVGTYLLSRFLGLHKLSSIFVALMFSLSPYLLRYLELLGGPVYTMYPWLFLSFLAAAKRPTLLFIALAAGATALLLFTGHTLLAVAGIFAASILFLVFSVFVYGCLESRKNTSIKALWRLSVIGAFSFLLAAPVILPFAELMQNAYCYKFNSARSVAPWTTSLYMLMHPGAGEWSAFIGVLAIPLFVCAFFSTGTKRNSFLSVCTALASIYLVMSPIQPFSLIIEATPLRMIPSTYFSYVFLLLFALGAGFGVDYLFYNGIDSRKKLSIVLVALAGVIFVPVLIHLAKIDLSGVTFDDQLPVAVLHPRFWFTDAAFCSLFAVALILHSFKRMDARILACAAVALCLVSELIISRHSLPVTPKFDFIETEAHRFFREKKERVSPQGFDLLAANSNSVYGIRSLALHNPMLPKRYINFMKAARAHVDDFNILIQSSPISRLFDLASLKYVIAFSPVVSEDEVWKPEFSVKKTEGRMFGDEISLQEAELFFNPHKKEIVGNLLWKSSAEDRDKYSYLIDVMNENGDSLWYGGLKPCFVAKEDAATTKFNLDAFLPENMQPGQKFFVGVKVFDSKKQQFIASRSNEVTNISKKRPDVFPVVSWSMPEVPNHKSDHRFKLVKVLKSPNARIYENTWAFPQAYLVPSITPAASSKEAVSLLENGKLNFAQTAVVELDKDGVSPLTSEDCQLFARPLRVSDASKTIMKKLLEYEKKNSFQTSESHYSSQFYSAPIPRVRRPSTNCVEVTCDSAGASFLVLCDMYYPGWIAKVDGVKVPLYTANYAFRGVSLGPGKHIVSFEFFPESFWMGIKLAAGLLIILSFTAVFARKKLARFGID